MELNWIESILYGFFAGFADVVPVSAQAHRMLLMELFGEGSESPLLRLLIHISTLLALYFCCQNHIIRISRAYKLAKIPKRRRKRPLDTACLMDLKLLRTMLLPVVVGFLFYERISGIITMLSTLAVTLFINGIILFVPQYLPGSNKESLSMTPLDGLLMGIGAVASLIPGISCIAIVTSVATVRGADKSYSLSMALLLSIPMCIGLIIFDLISLISVGIAGLSAGMILRYLLCAASAFLDTFLGVKLMRKLAAGVGFGLFAYYCWGAALFSFILFLTI